MDKWDWAAGFAILGPGTITLLWTLWRIVEKGCLPYLN